MAYTAGGDPIYYSTSVDPFDIPAITAAIATSVAAGFNKRAIRSYYWPTSTEQTAQVGMNPGDIGYRADIATTYVWLAGTLGWQTLAIGSPRVLSGLFQSGTLTGSASPYSNNGTVTFPTGFFTAAPQVVMTPTTGAPLSVSASVTSTTQISATSFNWTVQRTSTSNTTISWVAVQ